MSHPRRPKVPAFVADIEKLAETNRDACRLVRWYIDDCRRNTPNEEFYAILIGEVPDRVRGVAIEPQSALRSDFSVFLHSHFRSMWRIDPKEFEASLDYIAARDDR